MQNGRWLLSEAAITFSAPKLLRRVPPASKVNATNVRNPFARMTCVAKYKLFYSIECFNENRRRKQKSIYYSTAYIYIHIVYASMRIERRCIKSSVRITRRRKLVNDTMWVLWYKLFGWTFLVSCAVRYENDGGLYYSFITSVVNDPFTAAMSPKTLINFFFFPVPKREIYLRPNAMTTRNDCGTYTIGTTWTIWPVVLFRLVFYDRSECAVVRLKIVLLLIFSSRG